MTMGCPFPTLTELTAEIRRLHFEAAHMPFDRRRDYNLIQYRIHELLSYMGARR